eukprot:jgi/Picsp_1/3615/NSC_06452-R1_ovarian cancer-associated gene 2 protein homolog
MGEKIERGILERKSSRQFRVLFIHGFRQTAKGFHGRTRALQKRLNQWGLRNEGVTFHFEFAQGPHELPYRVRHTDGGPAGEASRVVGEGVFSLRSETQSVNLKRGWLLTQEQYDELYTLTSSSAAVQEWGPGQLEQQTYGWSESHEVLENTLERLGPFDCIFGFSQGAAIVGALCAAESLRPEEERRFKAAILASGYVSAAHLEIFDECKAKGNINIPSLHIYGDDAKDGQISNRKSEELMSKFRESEALRHDNGHLIPSSKEQVACIAEFISNSCSH